MMDWSMRVIVIPFVVGAIGTAIWQHGYSRGECNMALSARDARDELRNLQSRIIEHDLGEWRSDPKRGFQQFCLRPEKWPDIEIAKVGRCEDIHADGGK